MIDTVTHYSTTRRATQTMADALAGRFAQADWKVHPLGPKSTETTSDTAALTVDNDVRLSLTSAEDGDFVLLVSDPVHDAHTRGSIGGTTATISYGLNLRDALDVVGRSQRDWALTRFREAIARKLTYAQMSLESRGHRKARDYMADAQEMSVALQSIEGDALDGQLTATIGGMSIRVIALRDWAA